MVENVRRRVVGYEDVGKAVAIKVGSDDAHAVITRRTKDACLLGDIDEPAVTAIPIKNI